MSLRKKMSHIRLLCSSTGRMLSRSLVAQRAWTKTSLPRLVTIAQKQQLTMSSVRFLSNAPSSKREQELTDFLVSEIELERESQKQTLPTFEGWSVAHDGSDITLSKKYKNEEITIKANVCYSVDAANPEAEDGQMVCKPDFAIEVKKGNAILGLNCSFVQDEEEGEDGQRLEKLDDDFQINEISIYEGEFKKNNYAISGDVIDGNLYDLLMSILEDRGIDQNFAKKLIEYSTVYEHGQYVSLLGNLKKFFSS